VEKLATEGSMDQEDMETDAMLSIMMSMEPAFPAASSTATSSASGASSSSSSSAGAASLVPSRPVPASGGDSQQPNPGQPRPLHIVVDLWHASVTASLDALSSRSPEQPLGGPDHCNMSLVQADDTTYYVHWTGVASRHGRVVRIDPHGRAIYSIPAMVPARSFAHARVLVADIGVRMLKRTAALRCVCVCMSLIGNICFIVESGFRGDTGSDHTSYIDTTLGRHSSSDHSPELTLGRPVPNCRVPQTEIAQGHLRSVLPIRGPHVRLH
jgi:hypothetical protein